MYVDETVLSILKGNIIMYNFKYGYIYKITNLINNKLYIGQVYNKSIEDRFNRHCEGACADSKSYLGRAINKYGKDNFKVELIEECYSVQELNEREKYWIKYYNSTNGYIGYNLTPGGEGGNTYLCKSKKEMDIIRNKISKSNTGKNNGMSKQLKVKSIITNKEYHFDTLGQLLNFFNLKGKGVMAKANKKDNTLFRKEWLVAYENEEYQNYNMPNEHSRGTKVKVIDLNTNEEIILGSKNELFRFLKFKHKIYIPDIYYYNNYKIELLK